MTRTALEGLGGRLLSTDEVVIEATGNCMAVSRVLSPFVRRVVIANPFANMVLQGRHDTYPKRRGMTRVPELMAAGLTVALGHDSVMDPWYGLGSGDMLAVAHMAVHVAQMTGLEAMAACFAAVTENAARLLHLEDYGVAPGCRADMVLLDDNFASIVNAIEEGRAVFSNIRKFLTYILAHNVPELIPYLAFSLFSIPLALRPIQILSIDMGTDSLTALGLGVDKPDPRIMQRPPRSQHQRLFDWSLALRAYVFLGALEARPRDDWRLALVGTRMVRVLPSSSL